MVPCWRIFRFLRESYSQHSRYHKMCNPRRWSVTRTVYLLLLLRNTNPSIRTQKFWRASRSVEFLCFYLLICFIRSISIIVQAHPPYLVTQIHLDILNSFVRFESASSIELFLCMWHAWFNAKQFIPYRGVFYFCSSRQFFNNYFTFLASFAVLPTIFFKILGYGIGCDSGECTALAGFWLNS